MINWFKKEKQAVLISNSGREFILDPEIPNKIGRGHSAHVFVEDDLGVSRQNSVITCDKQTDIYYIEDTDSKHGTYVNGEKIEEKKQLSSGDIIGIGKETKFTFNIR
ncbi:MAG: FHA domain-containing protein [Candidatus Ratteibacteria bacterium]|nr:FHA domain-containing protein [Candidatus Ratteibacteria bacterium]